MSIISTLSGVIFGVCASLVGVSLEDISWWQLLIIAIVPTILGFALDLLVYILKGKKIINEEDANKLVSKVDDNIQDLQDDGKINQSNKEKK